MKREDLAWAAVGFLVGKYLAPAGFYLAGIVTGAVGTMLLLIVTGK